MTESGMSNRPGSASKSRRGHAGADQVQREVADHLGRRGDLDQAAEHAVGGGVHRLDVLEPVAEAQRDRLVAQVGQLPAGDLVAVDPAGRRRQAGLERRVHPAHRLPVRLQVARPRRRSRPVARSVWSVAATIADSGRLRRGAGHRGRRRRRRRPPRRRWRPGRWRAGRPAVSWVCRWTGRSNSRRSADTSVAAAGGAQQAGHVLDGRARARRRRRSARPAAGSSRGCRAARPGRTGRRCSRARPRRRPCRSRGRRRWPGASGRRR